MSEKQLARASALAARRAMSAVARAAQDEALVQAAVDLVRGAKRVAAYVPMPGEPGGAQLPDRLAAAVEHLLLPVLRHDRDLDWARYVTGAPMRGGVPGGPLLREPEGPTLGPDAVAGVDMVIVPALAVDRTGVRLGRGGASFDRALSRVPAGAVVVALLYEGELCDGLPAEPHDRPVTAILTPSGLYLTTMS